MRASLYVRSGGIHGYPSYFEFGQVFFCNSRLPNDAQVQGTVPGVKLWICFFFGLCSLVFEYVCYKS